MIRTFIGATLLALVALRPVFGSSPITPPLSQPPPSAEAFPQSPAMTESIAYELFAAKKWNDAIGAYTNLYDKEPHSASIVSVLTTSLVHGGQREKALGFLQEFSKHASRSQVSWATKKARVLSRLFLTNATFQAYQDGLNLLYANKFASASDKFEKALEEEPDNCEILLRLGQCLILENKPTQAMRPLVQAQKIYPEEPQIRLWLGRAYHLTGKYNEAYTALLHASAGLPGSDLAPVWLADTLKQMGKLSEASQVLENDFTRWKSHLPSIIAWVRLELQSETKDPSTAASVENYLKLAEARLGSFLKSQRNQENDLDLHPQKTKEQWELEIKTLSEMAYKKSRKGPTLLERQ